MAEESLFSCLKNPKNLRKLFHTTPTKYGYYLMRGEGERGDTVPPTRGEGERRGDTVPLTRGEGERGDTVPLRRGEGERGDTVPPGEMILSVAVFDSITVSTCTHT